MFKSLLAGIKDKLCGKPPAVQSAGEEFLIKIENRLAALEKNLADLQQLISRNCWQIDHVHIEKMQTDKVELNLETIDVKELSGMLNIGMNYGGEFTKVEHKSQGKSNQKQPGRTAAHRPSKKRPHVNPPKITVKYGSSKN